MNMAETLQFQALRGELRKDEPMSRHVSWRAGGMADRFYVPADLDDLGDFLRQLPREEPLLFVGLGSNLLVRDGGFRGTVVMTHASRLRPRIDSGLIYAEAGVASPKVARLAALHDMEGAEFLAGIPGCVGGARVSDKHANFIVNPQVSMRCAAWCLGGLRNTLPALGSESGWVAMRRPSRSFITAREARPSPGLRRNQAPANHSSPGVFGAQCR